ncbi:unnamed protein product [Heligmosomoides polygyrus]|uniref:PCI domain-containing protein n=1 Tax=Heligmosomoides polygyrus TaxID=6339 RepID=A0A183G6J7_HELPZ|nr:unnamed protein product [Heligmosomoides polygyrus]
MTREKLAKMFTARFAASSENLSRQRKMIGEQRLCRVVGSSLLKKFLKENNVSCKLPAPDPPKVQIRPAPEIDCGSSSELHHNLDKIDSEGDRSVVETGVSSEEAMCSLTDLRRLAEEESRADAAAFLKAVRLRDVSLTDDELLVIALSYSELFYKQAIRALKCVGDMCKRLEVIKALVSNVRIRGSSSTPRPNLPSTSSSTLELQLVESDLGRGEWLEAVSHCSPEHWKCRLLYQLISLCSPPEVFMDPSSPFCLKAFLHCMRRGAHCQKLAFVKCGVPYGREALECDFLGVLVDHSHIAAMQANPRYVRDGLPEFSLVDSSVLTVYLQLFEFIENGFDMSALTAMTVPSLMDVDMSVCAVLTRLIKVFRASFLCIRRSSGNFDCV